MGIRQEQYRGVTVARGNKLYEIEIIHVVVKFFPKNCLVIGVVSEPDGVEVVSDGHERDIFLECSPISGDGEGPGASGGSSRGIAAVVGGFRRNLCSGLLGGCWWW